VQSKVPVQADCASPVPFGPTANARSQRVVVRLTVRHDNIQAADRATLKDGDQNLLSFAGSILAYTARAAAGKMDPTRTWLRAEPSRKSWWMVSLFTSGRFSALELRRPERK